MRDRVIPAAALLVASLILFSDIRLIWAHGEPEKVVEGKYVVSLVLVPQGEEMSLRFFFRDFKTGHRLLVPISFHVKIRDPEAQKFIFESPNLRANKGVGDFGYQFSLDGFYEVFLQFEKTDEPGKIYRPEDWYLWIPARPDRGQGVPWTALAVLVVALATVWWWRRTAVRRQRGGRSSP